MSKLLLSCFVLLWAGSALIAETATNLTPEAAVIIALTNNRDLAAARFAIRQAEARLRQAGLWPNPELELGRKRNLLFNDEGEYSVSVGFRQRFPVAGRLEKAKAVSRVDVALALAEIRNHERLLIGEVLGRSRESLVIQEKLKANQEIQTVIGKLIEISEKRLKVAEVSVADVNLGKLELEKLTLAQSALLNQEQTALVALNRLLGREANTPLQISGRISTDLESNSRTEIIQHAVALRPDRQQAFLAINRAAAEIKLARAEKWDDWTVGVDYSHEKSVFAPPIGNKQDDFTGLSVSIPLPLWNRNQGKIDEAAATRERAQAELAALDLKIGAEVQTAENQVRRLLATLRQYREQSIRLAEENLSLLQKGYADGLTSIVAVIQAQQQLTDLRQAYLEVVSDLLRAQTEWETATASSPFLKSQLSNKP